MAVQIYIQMGEDMHYLVNGNPAFEDNGKIVVFQPNERRFYSFDPEDLEQAQNKIPPVRLKDKKASKTAELMLIVSRDCNLRCTYCFAYGGHVKTKMTSDVALAAIKHVLNSDNPERLKLTFSGGECTTNPDVIRTCIEYVKTLGIPATFIAATNGVINDSFLNYLIENKVLLSISNDGIPRDHDAMRPMASGKASSPHIEKTIRALVDSGSYFRTRSTITKDTVTHMPEAVEYFASLGVRFIDFELLDRWGKAADGDMQMVPVDEFLRMFSKAMDTAKRKGVSVSTAALVNLLSPSRQMCPGVIGKQFMVLPDGSVTRCNDVMDESHFLANLFLVGKYDSSECDFVVTRPEIEEKLDTFTVEDCDECNECWVKYICSGACIARHLWQVGCNTEYRVISDYQCQVNKGVIDLVLRRLWNASK